VYLVIEYIAVIYLLNLNSIINHCEQKTILIEGGRSVNLLIYISKDIYILILYHILFKLSQKIKVNPNILNIVCGKI